MAGRPSSNQVVSWVIAGVGVFMSAAVTVGIYGMSGMRSDYKAAEARQETRDRQLQQAITGLGVKVESLGTNVALNSQALRGIDRHEADLDEIKGRLRALESGR